MNNNKEATDKHSAAPLVAKRYADLYPPLVERVRSEEQRKYKHDRDRVKAVKNRLHVVYGAFTEADMMKKAEALASAFFAVPDNNMGEGANTRIDTHARTDAPDDDTVKRFAESVMLLHASTRERLPHLSTFYRYVSETVGAVETVLDLGCGFQPFALPWMPDALRNTLQTYHACDIDARAAALINRFFALLQLPQTAFNADLVTETPCQAADLAFVLKLVPVLENQRKGRGYALLREVNARFLAVSFPTRTLCGRHTGFAAHYAEAFEQAAAQGGIGTILHKDIVGDELVYVIQKYCDFD